MASAFSSPLADFLLEYVLGFMFGWSIFHVLFMRDMAGGSYGKAFKTTFIPELTSMNCLMARMAIVSMIGKAHVAGSDHPLSPAFWFIMSMALLVGLCAAYPMNYWLVANKLKHGMTTVRPKGATPAISAMPSMAGMPHMASGGEMAKPDGEHMDEHMGAHMDAHRDMRPKVSTQMIGFVVGLSFMILMIGLAIGVGFSQKS